MTSNLFLLLGMALFLCSCSSSEPTEQIKLVFSGSFFDGEQVKVRVNGETLYDHQTPDLDSFPDMRIEDEFFLEKSPQLELELLASFENETTLDTSFKVDPVSDSIFYLFISVPRPPDWEERMKARPPLPMGRPSLDSSSRHVSFKSYSQYKAENPMWEVHF